MVIKRLAPRIQKSIVAFEMQKANKPGITQQLPSAVGTGKDYMPEIPEDKLLMFTYRKEGDNPSGISILRNAYKHWWYKDVFYKVQGIAIERFGVGIPHGRVDKAKLDSERAKLENMLRNIRTSEKGYLLTDKETEVDILGLTSTAGNGLIQESISHHSRQIALSILGQFLQIGAQGTSGGYAQSASEIAFFELGLQYIAGLFSDQMNELIKKFIDFNFDDVKDYPKLRVTDIAREDINILTTALEKVINTGLVEPDERVMDWVRAKMRMPDRIVEEEDNVKTRKKPEDKEVKKQEKKEDKEQKTTEEISLADY